MAELVWFNRGALQMVLSGILLRCLPVMVYVFVASRYSRATQLTTLSGAIGLAFAVDLGWAHFWLLVTLTYFLLASVGVYWLELAGHRKLVSPGAVFVLSTVAFLVLPALMIPGGGEVIALAFGWECSFAAYSYCRDARSPTAASAPALSECIFFMMVNPVLVFPERAAGRPSQPQPWHGLLRALVGACGWLLGASVLLPLLAYASQLGFSSRWANTSYAVIALGVLRFVCAYFVQAGSANLRIGLLHSLGHPVPDAFNYPFLSLSPTDFWKRWNVYMLNWLKRYVYRPLTRTKALRKAGPAGLAASVFLTFVASGLLHETQAYARSARWVGNFASQFALIALGTVLWLVVDRGLKSAGQRLEVRPAAVRALRSWMARITIGVGMLTMPTVWG